MGQEKLHPVGFRLGIVKDHTSVWYADSKSYADKLLNDIEVRVPAQAPGERRSVASTSNARPSALDDPYGAPWHRDRQEG